MSTVNINKKSFELINRIGKTFSLYIANFETATTLIFRIIQQIDIGFVMSSIQKLVTTINIKKIRLTISTVKLIQSVTQTINAKYIKATYTIREIMKFVTAIGVEIPIEFVSKARQKIVTILYQGILSVTATAIYAVFFLLSEFDPQTLGTLDTEILQDMDYSLV